MMDQQGSASIRRLSASGRTQLRAPIPSRARAGFERAVRPSPPRSPSLLRGEPRGPRARRPKRNLGRSRGRHGWTARYTAEPSTADSAHHARAYPHAHRPAGRRKTPAQNISAGCDSAADPDREGLVPRDRYPRARGVREDGRRLLEALEHEHGRRGAPGRRVLDDQVIAAIMPYVKEVISEEVRDLKEMLVQPATGLGAAVPEADDRERDGSRARGARVDVRASY